MAGRPTSYTSELADEICERIGKTAGGLHKVCEADDMPSTTSIYKWLNLYPEFADKYTRAREVQADLMASQIIDIADDTSNDTIHHEKFGDMPDTEWINRSRLRVDSRKWLMSKLLPKKYGDKIDVTTDGQAIVPISGMVIQAKEKEG